ncbi:eukaryotic translation initiation factor 3 subunit J-B [Corythoichthys intestinalis]|uniref:eukaryotic translation initiation factor 3 subunit J-B n=1 Tax=Corythoichthys intestinalis TaxID=161448 RepID=UPI0025A6536C|nr:eukaryotic translation initiation factor 3 subunit J-B [Corythoichthys intestinalis]XP_061811293.1 eukaryotic translation initiation factor 3 subunit J-A-like [Nerophis lumbriciformis]
MADWDADNFELEEPNQKAPQDKWEGEDEDDDVKDNWDDEEDEEKKDVITTVTKVPEKKKLSEKIKERENRLKKKQQQLQEEELQEELTPEEQLAQKLRVQKLQEDADLELAKDAFGVGSTTLVGIDAMCPSSKEEFTEFEKLLKEKISQFEKSVHYSSFLDSLFRELCISLEVDDLKKVSNSLSVLLSEKQKQEKQNKGKKKKKGVVPGGGLKAQMRDDLDYGGFDGGYAQDYEDFM